MLHLKQYNFKSTELIESFNFDNLINNCPVGFENSAFLLITNKQYILSYTENKGYGYHWPCFVRLYKDIHGGGEIKSEKEAAKIEDKIFNYITGRITFVKPNGGKIIFLGLENVNKENYNIFLKFYEDYNDIIERICKENRFYVAFENNNNSEVVSKNLNKLLRFLRRNLRKSKAAKDDEDEIVLINTDRSNSKSK